jgi:hypothetical protein
MNVEYLPVYLNIPYLNVCSLQCASPILSKNLFWHYYK